MMLELPVSASLQKLCKPNSLFPLSLGCCFHKMGREQPNGVRVRANKPEKMEVLVPGVYQMLKDIILGVICLLVCPVLCDTRGETCQSEVQFH